MRKSITLFFLCLSFYCQSQVYCGIRDYVGEKTKPNKDQVYEKIKGSKILFVLPNTFTDEEYNKVLSESWKFSEYEVVSLKSFNENLSKYLKVGTVVAEYTGVLSTINYTNPNKMIKDVAYIFIDLQFYVVDEVKPGKKETAYIKSYFGDISFSPDYGRMRKDGVFGFNNITPKYLRNFKLGYLKNYLTVMSNNLSSKTLYDGYAEVSKEESLRNLKTKTLYIPQDVEQKNMGLFNREDKDLNKLAADYQFPKEFISIDELNKKILAGEEIYYLFYNQDNSKKIISVTNSKTGEKIYNVLERISYSVKDKDFSKLNKTVSKS